MSTRKLSTEVLPRLGFGAIVPRKVGEILQTSQYKGANIMDYSKKLLKLQQVIERVGQSKSTIYRGMDAGVFPRPVKLGSRMVRWLSDDIDDYLTRLLRSV